MDQTAPRTESAEPLRFRIPWPPSVNHYFRPYTNRDGTSGIVTRGGRAYRDRAIYRILEQKVPRRKLTGPLQIDFVAEPPDNTRRRDLDNLLKPALDALTHAGVIDDDFHVDLLTIQRAPARPPEGSLFVVVQTLQEVSIHG